MKKARVICGSLVLILSQAYTLAHAQEVSPNQQMAYLSIAPIPSIPRNPETGKPPVFDNHLLDQLFGKDRATKQEPKMDRGQSESTVNNQGAEENIVSPKPKIEPPLVRPNESFSERITSRTPSNQAAALRFAEQGRKHLRDGEYKRALECFEKAMGIGLHRYLPYVYYYLAWTHYNLGNYRHSLDFLEVAESSLTEQSEWMSVIAAVKDENFSGRGGARYAQVR